VVVVDRRRKVDMLLADRPPNGTDVLQMNGRGTDSIWKVV